MDRNSVTPMLMAFFAYSKSRNPERMTILVCGSSLRTIAESSKPSMNGILTSVMRMCGLSCLINGRASSPSAASPTSWNPSCSQSIFSLRLFRIRSSSSTKKTVTICSNHLQGFYHGFFQRNIHSFPYNWDTSVDFFPYIEIELFIRLILGCCPPCLHVKPAVCYSGKPPSCTRFPYLGGIHYS